VFEDFELGTYALKQTLSGKGKWITIVSSQLP